MTARSDSAPDADGPDGDPLRRRIAREAARQVSHGSDARRAVFRAARRVTGEWVPADRLPAAAEISAEASRRIDSEHALAGVVGDRFDALAALLSVLAKVRQDPVRHPEGDALEHSLQVFDLVSRERPFDEELLTAALVHDVGLAIDRRGPVEAGLEAVDGLITPRTAWLVATLPAARDYREGRLGHRARRRLEAHPDFLDVLLLAEADRQGRLRGYATPSLAEAIAILRELEAEQDGGPPS